MASKEVSDNEGKESSQAAMVANKPSTLKMEGDATKPMTMDDKITRILDRLDSMDTGMMDLKVAITTVKGTVETIDTTNITFRGDYSADVARMTNLLEDAKTANELEKRQHLITKRELDSVRLRNGRLESMVNNMENKLRLGNIRIDGKVEEGGEDLRRFVSDLAVGMGVRNMAAEDILTVYRIGGKQQGRQGRPRTIMVVFANTIMRNQFYYARTNLKKDDRMKRIYLNDDVTTLTKKQREDFRSVAELARARGAEVRIHSDGLIIDGKKFFHDDPQSLPDRYSLANAKTVEEGGELYFASEHSFLSNFSPSPITEGNTVYQTAEHMFQAHKCRHAVEPELMRRVIEAPTALDAKRIASAIQETTEWRQVRDVTMKKVIDEKFAQNRVLVDKLLETGDKRLNEATHNDYYGIGVPLHARQIKDKGYKGTNKLGLILMAKRDSIRSSIE